MSNVHLFNPLNLRSALVGEDGNLRHDLVTTAYTGGTARDGDLRPSLLGEDGNLKPGLMNSSGDLKSSLYSSDYGGIPSEAIAAFGFVEPWMLVSSVIDQKTATSTSRTSQPGRHKRVNGVDQYGVISTQLVLEGDWSFSTWLTADTTLTVLAAELVGTTDYIRWTSATSTGITVRIDGISYNLTNCLWPGYGVRSHLVIVRSGTDLILYQNGVYRSTLNSVGVGSMVIDHVAASSTPNLHWDGTLADYRFFGRAITASEVTGLVQQGSEPWHVVAGCPTDQVIGYYMDSDSSLIEMNNGSLGSAYDLDWIAGDASMLGESRDGWSPQNLLGYTQYWNESTYSEAYDSETYSTLGRANCGYTNNASGFGPYSENCDITSTAFAGGKVNVSLVDPVVPSTVLVGFSIKKKPGWFVRFAAGNGHSGGSTKVISLDDGSQFDVETGSCYGNTFVSVEADYIRIETRVIATGTTVAGLRYLEFYDNNTKANYDDAGGTVFEVSGIQYNTDSTESRLKPYVATDGADYPLRYAPLLSADPTTDVEGNAPQYTGAAGWPAKLVGSPCYDFDISDDKIVLGSDLTFAGAFKWTLNINNDKRTQWRTFLVGGTNSTIFLIDNAGLPRLRGNGETERIFSELVGLSDETDHEIIVERDADNLITITYDGQLNATSHTESRAFTVREFNKNDIGGVGGPDPAGGKYWNLQFESEGVLIAHYPMSETTGLIAYDVSGNDNHGDIIGGVALGTVTQDDYHSDVTNGWTPSSGYVLGTPTGSAYAESLAFDGVDDKVVATAIPEVDLAGTYTMSVWFKAFNPIGNDQQHLFNSNLNSSNRNVIAIKGGTGEIVGAIYDGATTQDGTACPTDGAWHNFIMTVNAGTLVTYLDGVAVTSTPAGTLNLPAGGLQIGARVNALTPYTFDGLISDCRTWSVVKTPSEVALIAAGTDDTTNLVYHATCDGNVLATPIYTDGGLYFDRVKNALSTGVNNTANNLTISAWVKPAFNTSANSFIESVGNGIHCSIQPGGAMRFTTKSVLDYTFAATVTVDEWVHITFVLDSSNDCHLYVNGVFSETITHTLPGSTSEITVGGKPGGATNWKGLIKDAVYCPTSLSPTEILALYNGTTPASASFRLPLESDLLDISGNDITVARTANDGTLTNFDDQGVHIPSGDNITDARGNPLTYPAATGLNTDSTDINFASVLAPITNSSAGYVLFDGVDSHILTDATVTEDFTLEFKISSWDNTGLLFTNSASIWSYFISATEFRLGTSAGWAKFTVPTLVGSTWQSYKVFHDMTETGFDRWKLYVDGVEIFRFGVEYNYANPAGGSFEMGRRSNGTLFLGASIKDMVLSDNGVVTNTWPLSGHALDIVGNNNGTVVGGVTFPPVVVPGDTSLGYATFDATEYLSVPAAAVRDALTTLNDSSGSVWFRCVDASIATQTIFGSTIDATDKIAIGVSSDTVRVSYYDAVGLNTSKSVAMTDDLWHYLTWSWDATANTVTASLDGVEMTTTGTNMGYSGTVGTAVGIATSLAASGFGGDIKDLIVTDVLDMPLNGSAIDRLGNAVTDSGVTFPTLAATNYTKGSGSADNLNVTTTDALDSKFNITQD